ncbi:MAG: IS110 family transposase [Clostridiales bacterium]|jgi:transposase|nr:IS110 family transposase [Clostridiales bacterium]
MLFAGIDVSKGKSKVAVVGEGKKVLQKPFDVAHTKTELLNLVSLLKSLGEEVHAVMEHTGIYYKVVAETLHTAGIRVSAVNPVLINQFGNNTLRKVKTDKKDAVKIARYALENRDELREYTSDDTVRDALKSFVKQFNFESKTLSAHKNNLKALLERVFPGIDDFFGSVAKPNGHQKLIDFVISFWHNDCVAALSESKFIEKYRAFCKKNRYIFKEQTAKLIHAKSRDNLTTLPKNDTTKLLVLGAAGRVLHLSKEVELLRAEMTKLAKQLPEYETVLALYGVGDTLAAQLIGEIGDVRRFESKRSLVAFAGVDPDKNDSGKKVSISGSVSRRGDALLRKVVYLAVESYLLNSPADETVYQFLDKKRSEGKHFYVYMTAACNKFLRVYYARVMECFNTAEQQHLDDQTA